MAKIGILTFHYSNNYGGVLQALSLQKVLESKGHDVEVINYVPSTYAPNNIICNLGFSKNIFKIPVRHFNILNIMKKIIIMKKHSNIIIERFDQFRQEEMKLSEKVDEYSLDGILNNYDAIIVGSDQIWNPSQRKRPEYFLSFGVGFNGKKISYAADSTTEEVDTNDIGFLKQSLQDFDHISVRNEHSSAFVKAITNRNVNIVADPTVLFDIDLSSIKEKPIKKYILTYILGKEIEGTHVKALEEIKRIYGDIPVYSIKIPTMNFELSGFADEVFYELDPKEWLVMFKNAEFIYTDSFHGVLFALKYNKPFLAYYTEAMRGTRFIDLGERYNIGKYIVQDVQEIHRKGSIEKNPDFTETKNLLKKHKEHSIGFLDNILKTINL